jgi:hypothetical protein
VNANPDKITDKITDKIRKLLRISENTPDENEASNALAQARRLASEYHLDMQAVAEQDQDPHELSMSDVELWAGNQSVSYRWQLAHLVAEIHGCAPWTSRRIEMELDRAPDEATIRGACWLPDTRHDSFTLTELPDGGVKLVTSRRMSSGGPLDAALMDKRWGWLKEFGPRKARSRVVLTMVGRRDAAQAAVYVYRLILRSLDTIAKQRADGRRWMLNSIRVGLVDGLRLRLAPESDEVEEREFASEDEPLSSTALVVLEQAAEDSQRFLADAFGSEPYKGKPRPAKVDTVAYGIGLLAADEIDVPDPNGGRTAMGSGKALPVGSDRRVGR